MIDLHTTVPRFSSILVIGGSGFIGRHLIAQLAATGRRVIVPTRRANRSRMFSVLPTVEVVQADIHDDAVLARLVAKVDAVINLVGILHSTRGKSGSSYGPEFAAAHVALPKKIVAACRAAGVERLLHVSALGASATGPSMYLRSKADGEAAVLTSGLDVTVFKPSVVFGPEDKFLNMFASLQSIFPLMPLGGAQARFQPVYVGDLVQAMINTLENPATYGHAYEVTGPTVYTLRTLVELAGKWSGHRRPVVPLSSTLAGIQAFVLEHLPGEPLMSRDNLDSMQVDNVASAPAAAILGIRQTSLESVAPLYLNRQP